MGFLGMVLELYSCISLTQTIVSYNKGATSLNILGHDHRILINGLTYTAVACHFVVFFSLFMALKFSFLVNWHFTYQDKVSSFYDLRFIDFRLIEFVYRNFQDSTF